MTPERCLFPKQAEFVTHEAKFKTACCSRRAGKTIGCGYALIKSAQRRKGSISLYLTLDRTDAKQIIWEALKDLDREYNLGCKINESELTMRLPNGSTVVLAGAGDERKISKRRGMPFGLVVIDEAQNFTTSLQKLIEDVIEPALMDYDGELWLTGTPGPVPVGYFYDCTRNPGWQHFSWTAFDNPWIERKSGKKPEEHMRAMLVRRGVTIDDPSVQREWFGRWITDLNSLVFKYDAARNHYDALPPVIAPWRHVIGVDLGFDDADAIAVLAFSSSSPAAYLVEEWTGTKQTITQLAERLRAFKAKYQPTAIVIDSGALGKKIAAEITQRTQLALIPAEKERKAEHIELVNDALRSGRLFARSDGRFAQDAMLLEWDRSNPEKPVISDKFHSDVADAVLYAYRWSRHWQHAEPTTEPPVGSLEHHQQAEAAMFDRIEAEIQERRAEAQAEHAWEWGWE